jgi:phosphohistidine phosphatase
MRLMLLRHAKAEKAAPNARDRDRLLDARGREDAARIGAYMSHHGLLPEQAIVSSAQRTRETWDQLAAAWSAPPPAIYEDRLYNADTNAILAVARTVGDAATLLLIGHNPGLHDAARFLTATGDVAARERLTESFPTAGLAVIDFAGDDWQTLHPRGGRLDRFITPRSIKTATD